MGQKPKTSRRAYVFRFVAKNGHRRSVRLTASSGRRLDRYPRRLADPIQRNARHHAQPVALRRSAADLSQWEKEEDWRLRGAKA
jgi:hypothetical protein